MNDAWKASGIGEGMRFRMTTHEFEDIIEGRFTRREFVHLSALGTGLLFAGLSLGCSRASKEFSQPESTMMNTRSKDGTLIAYWRSGSGPPLLLVHGTTADHTRWPSVLPALEERFTVYAVDRRGRGESGDAEPYEIGREFEDVAAVVDAIGGAVCVLGHSHGALCCLEASLLTRNIAKLILYEPYIPTGMDVYPPGIVDRIQALVDEGDRDGAVAAMFRELLKMTDAEIDALRSLPSWQVRVAAAHTIARETKAEKEYGFVPERFSEMNVPTLLLLGGESLVFLKKATEMVDKALPNSRIAVMPGQQHVAMNTAPEMFTGEVLKFLLQ